ncbi:hypothetical protein Tco_1448119 [Tanacetum coccineum]
MEEEAKAKVARREGEIRKEELIDLLGLEVVNKYYTNKLQYDKYCDKMLNRRAASRITNCDVLTRKGPITLKVYREDDTSEIIPNFKARTRKDYIHTTEAELRINLDIPLSKHDPLDKLTDLANKKRKHADDIYDYFKDNKRLKSSDFVTIEDFIDFPYTMLYTVQEIFFRLHQGLGLDDYARTFSSLLLAEIDKRNLNPLKQMRVIEQLRHPSASVTEVPSASALQVLRRLGSIFTSLYAAIGEHVVTDLNLRCGRSKVSMWIAMLPQIREQVREEYRTGAVGSGSNPPPVTIPIFA